jgi:hypothetical protein
MIAQPRFANASFAVNQNCSTETTLGFRPELVEKLELGASANETSDGNATTPVSLGSTWIHVIDLFRQTPLCRLGKLSKQLHRFAAVAERCEYQCLFLSEHTIMRMDFGERVDGDTGVMQVTGPPSDGKVLIKSLRRRVRDLSVDVVAPLLKCNGDRCIESQQERASVNGDSVRPPLLGYGA